MSVISIINHKGGVGKSAVAFNLAAFLRLKKKTVLLIDLDPEGNLTQDMGLKGHIESGIGDCIKDVSRTGQSIVPVKFKHRLTLTSKKKEIYVLPTRFVDDTNTFLEKDIAKSFSSMPGHKNKLSDILDFEVDGDTAREYFDYIIIDCPPANSHSLSDAALQASDYAIISTTAKARGFGNIDKVTKTYWAAKEENPRLELLGILFNIVNTQLSTEKDFIQKGRDIYKKDVFKTIIPSTAKFERTIINHQPVCSLSQRDPLHVAYKAFTDEVNSRVLKSQKVLV